MKFTHLVYTRQQIDFRINLKLNLIVVLVSFILPLTVQSQTILNGDFEDNEAMSCMYNMMNSSYNLNVNNSWGFGSGNELDLQKNDCGYAISPSNNWFVSLSKLEFQNDGDALSLKIDTNLTMGNTYEISYFEFASDTNDNVNIPIEIGLSDDSLSFGDLIYTSLPLFNIWTLKTFTFTAPNSGRFITIRIDTSGMDRGWNFIDNIHFPVEVGLNNETIDKSEVLLLPNPTLGNFNVTLPSNSQEVKIFTSTGHLVKNIDVKGLAKIDLNLDAKGIYNIQVLTQKNIIVKKLVVY